MTPKKCYFRGVSIVTAKRLHQETREVLNQVERGASLRITRNGRTIGRIVPETQAVAPAWDEVMGSVWDAHRQIQASERQPNPVLAERQRRRR